MIAAMTSRTGAIGFRRRHGYSTDPQFEVGYEEGARTVNPKIRVISNYIGVTDSAWNDPVKGKELAQTQIEKGADVIFAAAGNSGLGTFDAVEQYGKDAQGRARQFVIGVDSNQNWVKPGFVLTSMVKRVDNAVYQIVRDRVDNQPIGGSMFSAWRTTASATRWTNTTKIWSLLPSSNRRSGEKKIIDGQIKVTDAMEK